jgi:hypothetical protein
LLIQLPLWGTDSEMGRNEGVFCAQVAPKSKLDFSATRV